MAQTTNDPIGAALQDLRNRGDDLLRKPGQKVSNNPMAAKEQLEGENRGTAPNLYGDGISDRPELDVSVQKPVDPRRTGPSPMTGGTGPGRAADLEDAGSLGQIPVASTTRNQLPPVPLQGVHPAATGPRLPGAGFGLGSQTPGTLPPRAGATYLHR